MFWLNTKRVLRSGFLSFVRNGFVSLSSILVMTVTLSVIAALLFLSAILQTSLEMLRDKVDVNVYFLTTATEEDIVALQQQIEALPEVSHVTYTSREQALEQFRERHKDDQLTLQALDELGENPLGASLSIKARETSQYEGIARFLGGEDSLSTGEASIVEKVNYFQNKAAIDRLTRIITATERLGLAITVILILASITITFNTIRLVIYTAKEEIAVMKLVGASNMYVRGPFVFAGIIYGVASALLTLALFYPLTLSLGPATQNFFGDINIFTYYLSNFAQIFLIILLSGIILGGLSSYLAVKRHLKV